MTIARNPLVKSKGKMYKTRQSYKDGKQAHGLRLCDNNDTKVGTHNHASPAEGGRLTWR